MDISNGRKSSTGAALWSNGLLHELWRELWGSLLTALVGIVLGTSLGCGSDGSADTHADGGLGRDTGPRAQVDASVPNPGADAGTGDPGTSSRRIIGYFAAWGVYGRDYHVTNIPAARLTHVNYAFANISESGECVLAQQRHVSWRADRSRPVG
ncbi:MAG: hypothetical protein HY698_08830 [Deltaproteobacteria bacterium]|nr:hypothetical protein [Deltaproteobacteria bacterium]